MTYISRLVSVGTSQVELVVKNLPMYPEHSSDILDIELNLRIRMLSSSPEYF